MTLSRRLIVTTIDLPYPPNYGHKVDQFYRWRGFAERGWQLRLICWRSPADPPKVPGAREALGEVFEQIDELPIDHRLPSLAKRLSRLPRYPSHVASRIPDSERMTTLIQSVRDFEPDAVILDGIFGAYVGEALAKAVGVPFILRGHNVEHRYFAQQARAVTSLRSKIAWSIARFGLERFEEKLLNRAAWTFDISADDVRYWQDRGVEKISWSPTVYPEGSEVTIVPSSERRFDVAYIGNMRLPNNLRGLEWFVREVLPILRQRRPLTTYCFAGANPSEAAHALFADAPEIAFVPNAPCADEILANGRVLINPILSGSGVNVKSIDMLRYDAPIVTTSIGAQGLGKELDGQFLVHDDASSFAQALVDSLAQPEPPAGRVAARTLFGPAGLDAQIALVERVVTSQRKSAD